MRHFLTTILLILLASTSVHAAEQWPIYGGNNGTHFSPFTQINTSNVKQLSKAWEFHTGQASFEKPISSSFSSSPVLSDNKLIFCTPLNDVLALNPETGKTLWRYHSGLSFEKLTKIHALIARCRGVAVWQNKTVFAPRLDGKIVALNAATGEPILQFGDKSFVDLNQHNTKKNHRVFITAAPTIYKNLVITGSSLRDNVAADMPDGKIIAFDVHSGKVVWSFNLIPPKLHNKTGANNIWETMTVDTASGTLFAPTSGPSPDHYGGLRPGNLPYSSGLLALDAATGHVKWHHAFVHHNLWDYDTPAQPLLVDIHKEGKTIPAVVQPTKMGLLFIVDRRTGKSLFPITEVPVPASDVPGEVTSPTQPLPSLPLPLAQQSVSLDDMWGAALVDRYWCRKEFKKLVNKGPYTPPVLYPKWSVSVPASAGGMNWGHAAYDPTTGHLFANNTNLLQLISLIPRAQYESVKQAHPDWDMEPQTGTPYGVARRVLLSPFGAPCNAPPWGTLSSVDLASGQLNWQVPFGSVKFGWFHSLRRWGSPTIGGPLATGGGLIFIGAGMDNRFSAIDSRTGKELWSYTLPAWGASFPMSYQLHGRQFIVLAAGGGMGANSKSLIGDSLIAFALPKTKAN